MNRIVAFGLTGFFALVGVGLVGHPQQAKGGHGWQLYGGYGCQGGHSWTHQRCYGGNCCSGCFGCSGCYGAQHCYGCYGCPGVPHSCYGCQGGCYGCYGTAPEVEAIFVPAVQPLVTTARDGGGIRVQLIEQPLAELHVPARSPELAEIYEQR